MLSLGGRFVCAADNFCLEVKLSLSDFAGELGGEVCDDP